MQDPSNSVVDKLGFRESLVPAFVSNDPQPGGEEAGPEAVQGPKGERRGGVEVGVWQGECFRRDEAVQVLGRAVRHHTH